MKFQHQIASCCRLEQALLWWCDLDGRATIERFKDAVSGKWYYGLFTLAVGEDTPDYL